ncbi:glycosyltransferase [Psychroserpens algicola]|uniref:Glycosyltransferase n=1 Tax=Psychroserpens algicola TaxID=1719034 RepID=A0ABT0H5A2_9FLAO|nr:glycosyltransferase [Psychroserpens algicola]MCK8479566.1 glycosyltransferase [Psychroserpens algicola]
MKQPLKIAFVVGTFPVVSQTFIVNQINALIDEGHDVNLYAYKKGELHTLHTSLHKHNLLNKVTYLKKNNPNHGIRFLEFLTWTLKHFFKIRWKRYFKTLNIFKYGKEAFLLSIFFAMEWSLIEDEFDIIHVHFAHNAKLISYLKSLGLFPEHTKLMTTLHGYDLIPSKSEFYKENYHTIFEQTNMFTVNSVYLKEQLLSVQPQLKHVAVLPVGLDTAYFTKTEQAVDNKFFDILFCGRLIKLKGPEIAILVLERLVQKGHTNVRLNIIGDGVLYDDIKQNIKDKKLETYVKLKGELTQDSIKNEMDNADVLIMPGIADPETGQMEAQGLVIQEAQAMELPVVVSDAGGMKYGVLPNESGFVVKANAIDAFVEALEQLIVDDNLRLRMGKKGAEFVREHFDNAILAKQLIDMYHMTLETNT